MAVGDSIISICNIGLGELGEDPIVSLGDNNKRAINCAARYDDSRRAVLRAHPWNCAKKLAQLAASATAPLARYGNAFPVPADFLRLNVVLDAGGEQPTADPYDIVGNAILSDAGGPLPIEYGSDLQDPTQFDALLSQCIGIAVAAAIAVSLTKSTATRDKMLALLEAKLATARTIGNQENSVKEWDEDVWLRSRNG